jgi:hypothetical protein
VSNIQERVIARLRRNEDGSLSNSRIEQYALLRSECVVTLSAAWVIIMGRASGSYRGNIHKSPAFKARLEELVAEREQLQEQGPWGQLEWQTRQNYRRAVAINDVRLMTASTEMLYKILSRGEKPPKAEKPEEEAAVPRGPGAPVVEDPSAVYKIDSMREQLLGR